MPTQRNARRSAFMSRVGCVVRLSQMRLPMWADSSVAIAATPGLVGLRRSLARYYVRMVVRVGGFLNRKGDGFPGAQVLWIRLQRDAYVACARYSAQSVLRASCR